MLQFCSVSNSLSHTTLSIKWEVYFSKRLCRSFLLRCYDFACICVCIVIGIWVYNKITKTEVGNLMEIFITSAKYNSHQQHEERNPLLMVNFLASILRYLCLPQTGEPGRRPSIRWVQAQGCCPDTPSCSKKTSGPIGIPARHSHRHSRQAIKLAYPRSREVPLHCHFSKSTLTQNGRTSLGPIYGSNNLFKTKSYSIWPCAKPPTQTL